MGAMKRYLRTFLTLSLSLACLIGTVSATPAPGDRVEGDQIILAEDHLFLDTAILPDDVTAPESPVRPGDVLDETGTAIILAEDHFEFTVLVPIEDSADASVSSVQSGYTQVAVGADVILSQKLFSDKITTTVRIDATDWLPVIEGFTLDLRYLDVTDFTPAWEESFAKTASYPTFYMEGSYESKFPFVSENTISVRYTVTVDLIPEAVPGEASGTGVQHITMR